MDLKDLSAVHPQYPWKYVLVIRDHFTGYSILHALRDKEATTVLRKLNRTTGFFGTPTLMHTDNGSEFANDLLRTRLRQLGASDVQGRPHWPRSQGAVEVVNRTLSALLIKFTQMHSSLLWKPMLPYINMAMNEMVSEPRGMPSCELLFGTKSLFASLATETETAIAHDIQLHAQRTGFPPFVDDVSWVAVCLPSSEGLPRSDDNKEDVQVVEARVAQVHDARKRGRVEQEKSRNKRVLQGQKHAELLDPGVHVLVPVPAANKRPHDPSHIPAVVLERTHAHYRLGLSTGRVTVPSSTALRVYEPSSSSVLHPDQIPNASTALGSNIPVNVRCGCLRSVCNTGTCSCRKEGRKCSSHCTCTGLGKCRNRS